MYNLSYDYCAAVLLVILILFYFASPKYYNLQNRLFSIILVTGFFACSLDIISSYLLDYAKDMEWANRFAIAGGSLTLQLIPMLYVLYICAIVFAKEPERGRRHMLFLSVPGAINALVNLVSPFVPITFTYSALGGYSRTGYYAVALGIAVFYLVAAIVYMLVFSKRTSFIPRFAVFVYTFVIIGFAVIQYHYPSELLMCASAAFSMFIMFLALQNPELLNEALEDAETLKKAAEEASAAKSVFLANMNHEIRTPMNAIRGMTYLLESADLKSDARDYVATIQSASESLLELINKVLDFSKVDAGKMELDLTAYKLDRLVRESVNLVLPQVDQTKVAVCTYIDPDMPMVIKGDLQKVKNIITNLLSNAVKFTDAGQILLSMSAIRKADDKFDLVIKVKDTGIGIKEEDMARLFTQFEQVDMAINRKKEGAGLGLSIVKSYCELMGGSVQVESTFGEGSTFTVVVEQEAVEEFPSDVRQKMSDYFFVVLESNTYVRKTLEKTLKGISGEFMVETEVNRETLTRHSGKQCIILFDEREYGVVVRNSDFNGLANVKKVSMIDYNYMVPENSGDVSYIRKPVCFTSFLNWFTEERENEKTAVSELDKEDLYFSDSVKVALVDDNKVNLKVTDAILKRFGITPVLYSGGHEIIDAMKAGEEFDFIFMDHMMPEMDGVETTKQIREITQGKRLFIVALTANAVKGVEEQFIDAGMDDAIFKPISIMDLKRVLKQWIPAEFRRERPAKEA